MVLQAKLPFRQGRQQCLLGIETVCQCLCMRANIHNQITKPTHIVQIQTYRPSISHGLPILAPCPCRKEAGRRAENGNTAAPSLTACYTACGEAACGRPAHLRDSKPKQAPKQSQLIFRCHRPCFTCIM